MAMRPKWAESIRRGGAGGGILGNGSAPAGAHADDWRDDVEEVLHQGEGREYDSIAPDETPKRDDAKK